jgi:hypothetical protein
MNWKQKTYRWVYRVLRQNNEKPRNNNENSYPNPGVNIIQKEQKYYTINDGDFKIKIPMKILKMKLFLVLII